MKLLFWLHLLINFVHFKGRNPSFFVADMQFNGANPKENKQQMQLKWKSGGQNGRTNSFNLNDINDRAKVALIKNRQIRSELS
jgi:hypothetical protein